MPGRNLHSRQRAARACEFFGELPRARNAVRTVATSLPESAAPLLVTSGSGSGLRRGAAREQIFFSRRFMARIEFYMHKNNERGGHKKLSGQSTDLHGGNDDGKFKAG